MNLFFNLVIFIFGLLIGSFLNCLIYRLEKKENFLKGRSYCPHCHHQLNWSDLIPILSFIFLKGKCRYCKKKISWQYPLVEITTGLLFLSLFIVHCSLFIYIIACFLIIIFVILGAIFITPFLFKRSKEGKKSWDKFSLKLPILGEFYKKVSLTRFSENLSVLISAGLPITSALEITKSIIGNDVYEKIVAETGERVARGETISSVFLRYPEVIPAFVTQMISTGEKTGRLEDTLMDVVNFYKAEIDRTINNLTSILEPILLLVLGIGVGIMVISLFLPLFSIGLGGMEGM